MDTQATITGLILSLIVITLLILIQTSQKKQKKHSKKEFYEEALKHHLNVHEADFWGTYYAIAIDEIANKIIYSRIIDEEHNISIIDLSLVHSCSIDKTERRVKNKAVTKTSTDKIDLVINYTNIKKTKSTLEFYNIDVNFEMDNESILLKKWETIINSRIIKHTNAA